MTKHLSSRLTSAALTALCLSLLSACAVGPKYVTPAVTAPPAYKEPAVAAAANAPVWKASQPSDTAPRGNWWESFNDARLNELEAQLNSSNQNIAAAAANVLAARALIRESRSQYLPTITTAPAIANAHLSTFGPKASGATYSTFGLPAEASWEPDLFNRVRNTVSANTLAAQAAIADLENIRLSAQADLATDYFELRYQDELKRVLDATVASYREALSLNRSLFDSGLASDEAVAQSETQLAAAEAQSTNLAILRAQYEHAIAVLTGQPAPSFALAPDTATPVLPSIPPGVPSELLQRRPDIASAERDVAQANARIGIAQAAFYPAITLAATGGLQNLSIEQWLTWPSRIWSVGPSLAYTLFDGGLRRATVQQYQAAYDQTVANYRQTVLTAFQQVEDNLATLNVISSVIARQDAAIQSAERTLSEAGTRYTAGLDPYLNVISAQTVLLSARQTAVAFREQQMVAGVQLIKALGGGWDAARLPSSKDLQRKLPATTSKR